MAQRFAKAVQVALLVLFCLSLSVSVLVSDEQFTASKLKQEAVAPTRQYLDFVFFLASFPDIFQGNEASHMRDVAWLLRCAPILAVISALLLARFTGRKEWASITNSTLSTFVVIGLIAIITPFDAVFRIFHLVFFPQGNWTFPADSTLISFYPQEFFAWYAVSWFCYALLTALVLKLLSRAIVE